MSTEELNLDTFKEHLEDTSAIAEETESFEEMFLVETTREDVIVDEEEDYFDRGTISNDAKSRIEQDLEFQAAELLDSYHSLAKQKLLSEKDRDLFRDDLLGIDDLLTRYGNHNAIDVLSSLYLEIEKERFTEEFNMVKQRLSDFVALDQISLENADNMSEDASQATVELQEQLLEILISHIDTGEDNRVEELLEDFQSCPNREDFQVDGFLLKNA